MKSEAEVPVTVHWVVRCMNVVADSDRHLIPLEILYSLRRFDNRRRLIYDSSNCSIR